MKVAGHAHDASSESQRTDRIGAAGAGILATVALLPQGFSHLGWSAVSYVELAVPALVVVWVAARRASTGSTRPPVPTWPWDLLVAVTTGAAILGLLRDNLVTSPVFPSVLRAGLAELVQPMDMAAHPLYSVRVGLTFLEGWIAFRLIVAICSASASPARRARLLLAGWLVGLGLAAAGALLQYVTEFNLHPYWVHANPSLVRAHSTLDDPNTLGAVLAAGVGLIVGLMRAGDAARQWIWRGLVLLLMLGTVTTMSRSALGALALAPLAVLAIVPAPTTRWQRQLQFSARLAIGTVVVLLATSMVLREFTSEQRRTNPTGPFDMVVKTFDPRESTGWVLRGRLPWWQAAASMFESHPIDGVGLGRYPRLMGDHGGGRVPENAHNLYLQLAAEAGILGLAAGLAFSVGLVVILGRLTCRAATSEGRAAALGGTIGVVAFLLTMLTGHALLLPSGQILLAGLVAPALVMAFDGAGRSTPRSAAVRRGTLLLALVAMAAPPLAGLASGVSPEDGPWGYAHGLYGDEPGPGGEPVRWTTGQARLDLPVPDGATVLVVRVGAVVAIRDGHTTRVVLATDDTSAIIDLASHLVETASLPLAVDARRVLLQIDVTPTFVPGGGDRRTLGVQISPPSFEFGDRSSAPD